MFLMCFLFAINGMFLQFIVYFFCLILHEYCHIFVAKKLGYKTGSVYLTPFGATVNINTTYYKNHELIIALSAPILNFILLTFTISMWWCFPQLYGITYHFAVSNFALCFFNLLPIYPLDGSKVLCFILNKFTTKTKNILIVLNVIFSIIFVILAIVLNNFSLCLMAVLFVLSLIEKQSIVSPVFQTATSNSLPLNTIVVSNKTKLYQLNKMLKQNSLNRFFVVDNNLKVTKVIYQSQLIDLFSNNSAITKIEDVLIK